MNQVTLRVAGLKILIHRLYFVVSKKYGLFGEPRRFLIKYTKAKASNSKLVLGHWTLKSQIFVILIIAIKWNDSRYFINSSITVA
jgi:hypothetical protein